MGHLWEETLLTSGEVCRALGISVKALQALRRTRKIAYVRVGFGTIRFRQQAVTEFMRKRDRAIRFAEGRAE
jgi:excisionase family DNA binding protein